MRRLAAALLVLACAAAPASAMPVPHPVLQDAGPAEPPAAAGDPDSPWYLERGTHRRTPRPADDVPEVVFALEALLRDGGIPGFYDGQFTSTQDRFDELVRVARDTSMHHTIRIMAVMAAQEAADGPPLRQALQPLLIDPELEYQIERIRAQRDYWRDPLPPDEVIRRELDVDLSRYARFALAKDGQPEAILDRIRVLEQYVLPKRVEVLDPLIETFGRFGSFDIYFYRTLWFDIAYHYQQFDDYASAAGWFRQLTGSLDGQDARMAHYNLACIAALTGNPEEAVAELRGAMEDGFLNVTWMDEDGDLESLRGLPTYEALRREMLGLDPEAPSDGPEDEEPSAPADPPGDGG